MAQPSVASFFNNRKRSMVEDTKINRVRKVLVLDSSSLNNNATEGLEGVQGTCLTKIYTNNNDDSPESKMLDTLQEKEEKTMIANKIIPTVTRKVVRATKSRKFKDCHGVQDIQQLLNNITKKDNLQKQDEHVATSDEVCEKEKHVTPPSTPTKNVNAMDKVQEKVEGPSLKEIKQKMMRSSRLAELKTSLQKLKEGQAKLKQIEKKTAAIPESPKLKSFKTIELEVHTSPQKSFSPEKAYLSPRKDNAARRNLLNLLSPTKNAVPIPSSPSKKILETTLKPALTLPFKYRYLAEMFRSIDTVMQILHNRKETVTFRKLKPAVEEMLKRNLLERHLAQIKNIYPDAFVFTQEKLRVYGAGVKKEQWELVITPAVNGEHISSDILLERRRILFNNLLDKVKEFHSEFLKSLDPPMEIPKDKITRWHPEFDIEKVPDIELSEIPKPPAEETFITGKDVLEKAKQLFHCNTRMEQALEKLKSAREANPDLFIEKPKEENVSVLKGIPKALLEKVRQRQAAKALVSMTRSADKEKEVQQYSRLPEIARLTRNLFVSEKKSVLPLDVVLEKLSNCYRENLTKTDTEEHLKLISKEVPGWLVFHNLRNTMFVKVSKNADVSLVINKLETLSKEKSES